VGKFVAKYRPHEEDYSDGYDSTRSYDSKKRKKESAEFRKMRQRHRDEEPYGFEYVDKRYSKHSR
jgi:hypothetical protein